jgi:hypothetical protein
VGRGFDGGQEARAAIEELFATVESRSRPAPPTSEPGGGR